MDELNKLIEKLNKRRAELSDSYETLLQIEETLSDVGKMRKSQLYGRIHEIDRTLKTIRDIINEENDQ